MKMEFSQSSSSESYSWMISFFTFADVIKINFLIFKMQICHITNLMTWPIAIICRGHWRYQHHFFQIDWGILREKLHENWIATSNLNRAMITTNLFARSIMSNKQNNSYEICLRAVSLHTPTRSRGENYC